MVKSIFVLIHSWPSLEVMCILSYPSCSTSAATSQTDSQTVRSVTLYLGVVRGLFWVGTRQQQYIPIYQDHFVRPSAQRHGSLVPGDFWHFLLSPIQNWCVQPGYSLLLHPLVESLRASCVPFCGPFIWSNLGDNSAGCHVFFCPLLHHPNRAAWHQCFRWSDCRTVTTALALCHFSGFDDWLLVQGDVVPDQWRWDI